MKLKVFLIILSSSVILFSCTNPVETPTYGKIKVGIDESYQLLAESEIDVFEANYKHASITPVYSNEAEVFDLFMKDSIRNMIVNRTLSEKEKEYLNGQQIFPRTTKIAIDGVAFIVNKDNPDTLLSYIQVKNIFTGQSNTWGKLNPRSRLNDIKVVFDNKRSGNVRYLMEKFGLKDSLPSYCKAVNTNPDVIDYVEKHKDALGVISINWISDKQDSVSHAFLSKIKVVEVSSLENLEDFNKPYQGYIANQTYPFIREVYYISRETFSGLGTGFASFVAGEQGQRIILKSRLVPATMPIRMVRLKKD